MFYQNFKNLKEFKRQFKKDLQYISSLTTTELMQQFNNLEATATTWIYNFCTVEQLDQNYINLYWTSEEGKSYNLMDCFKEFTDYYNFLLDFKFQQNKLCNFIDDISSQNWKF